MNADRTSDVQGSPRHRRTTQTSSNEVARPTPLPSSARALLALQQSAGNKTTSTLLASGARTPSASPAGQPLVVQRIPDRAGVQAGRYDFSTRCGWIDWGHASPGLAHDLVARVRTASASVAAGGQPADLSTPEMTSRGLGVVLSSAKVNVKLKQALSEAQVLQVALSIFKRLSIDFETQQAWTDSIGDSSFAQEDLPSNLIGFYMAARNFTRADLTTICGVVDRQAALQEFDARPAFTKNTTFQPVGASEAWPTELSTIDSAAGAALYDIVSVDLSRGAFRGQFAPRYRIEGTVGETDLFVISLGGTRFTAAQDVQVIPTYQAHDETSGRYGHIRVIQVNPARPQDRQALEGAGLSLPVFLPQPILVPLTQPGSP